MYSLNLYCPSTQIEVVKTDSPNLYKPPTRFAVVNHWMTSIRFAVLQTNRLKLYKHPT